MLWSPSWKQLWRHNPAVGGPIWIKFGMLTHSFMAMIVRRWKPETEVEFQHGGRFFQETESSNISTVDWEMSPKFDFLDFDLSNWAKSPKTKLLRRGRHLEKSMWRHNSVRFIRCGWNLVVRVSARHEHWKCSIWPHTCPKTANINKRTTAAKFQN